MEIVIIGGGLIGMLTARELAMAGEDVTLLEKGEIGGESSWAGGGILSPLYPWRYADAVNRLAKWGQQHYPELAETLLAESGVDPQWTQSGLLVLDSEEREAASVWAKTWEMSLEIADSGRTRELEPELVEVSDHTLWFPDIAQVRNPRMIKSVMQSCQHHGVQVLTNSPVTRILQQNGRVTGVETSSSAIQADAVIVASGAWSASVLDGLGVKVEIHPVRGQMLMYRGQPGLVQHIVLSKGHYVIPRRDGRILVGSTLEETGFDKSTTQQGEEELRQFAQSLLPCVTGLPVERHWAGLRPASPDGIPYICSIPGCEGLFLNSGHFRNGVILGPASAQLMADIVLARTPILDIQSYQVDRA